MILLALALTTQAHAATTLLDCNVEGGNQQVKVAQSAAGLELQELTSAGSWKKRALSQKEWDSRNLRLSGDVGETYLMYLDTDGKTWFYQNVGGSFRQFGQADCR